MPEAPEVQTVLKTLETQIKDALIEDVFVYYPKIIDNVDIDVFKNHVIGQSFRSFDRIGKYLIFGLDDYDLVVHLLSLQDVQTASVFFGEAGVKIACEVVTVAFIVRFYPKRTVVSPEIESR